MGETAGNLKIKVPWALDDPVTKPDIPIWGALDAVNRQYVRKLLEDASGLVFIGADPPDAPLPGKLWWRNDPDGVLYIYYTDTAGNSQWVPASPNQGGTVTTEVVIPIQETPPPNPRQGMMWIRNDPNMMLCTFYNGQWVQI
jgi:hypothetical protein